MNRLVRTLAAAALVAAAVTALPVPATAGPPLAVPEVATANRPHPHRKPWPVTLTVRTLPAIRGIRLTLDGVQRVTDANGVASWTQPHNYSLHVLALRDSGVDGADRRYRFARWAGQRDPGQAFRTTVTGLPMRRDYTVDAAFTVQYPVRASFVDQAGKPIDTTTISGVRVKSDDGQTLAFPTDGPIWLDGTRLSYNRSVLAEADVTYSLQSIMVHGTNVVDAGRQKFVPAKSPTVTFTGQFHDLTVRAHDAMLGSAAGQSAQVTYPDGSVATVAFGADHSVTLRHLPRGSYQVSVVGPAIVMSDQFTLSRDHVSDVAVLSRLDEIVLGVAAVAVAIGLLLVGRAGVRRLLRRVPAAAHRRIREVPGAARRARARVYALVPIPRTPSDAEPDDAAAVEPDDAATVEPADEADTERTPV